MQKLVPCLWFDKEADEAIDFYLSVFNSAPHSKNDSRIVSVERYPEDKQIGPEPDMGGKVLTAVFELASQRFMRWTAARCSSSPKPPPSTLSAPTRRRSITSGRSCRPSLRPRHAAG